MNIAWRQQCAVVLRRSCERPRLLLQRQQRALSGSHCVCAQAAAAPAATTNGSDSDAPADATTSPLAALEKSLAQRDHEQALRLFDELTSPPSSTIAQRLAILLAKNGRDAAQVARAHELLTGVYMLPAHEADDYTKLASIYVVDACVRHSMVDEAVQIYEEALNAGVVLDLPAYDALLHALVDADQVDDAVSILKEIVAQKDVSPTEQTYAPLLLALMTRFDYTELIDLIDHGRTHGIAFTLDTYDPLVDLGEMQGNNPDLIDGLEKFMVYVNQALEDDGLLNDFDDDDDESEIEIEFDDSGAHDDGDDDDESDDDFH